jgi:hypothetical protein
MHGADQWNFIIWNALAGRYGQLLTGLDGAVGGELVGFQQAVK